MKQEIFRLAVFLVCYSFASSGHVNIEDLIYDAEGEVEGTSPPETQPPETQPPKTQPPETPFPDTPAPDAPPPGMEEVWTYQGCFKDRYYNRAFPLLFANYRSQIDWKDRQWPAKVLQYCSKMAKQEGYYEFGIQFYGECWAGPENEHNFKKHGSTDKCFKGVGRAWTNAVYKFEVRETT